MSIGEFNFISKIIVIGDSGVGKTCIIERYTKDEFNENQEATLGMDFEVKTINHYDKICKLHIWDTAGQERFNSLNKTYYKGAKGVIIVYDITKKESFEKVKNWMEEVKKNADENVCIMLIGNKLDLNESREVSKEDALKKADEFKAFFIETSAKTKKNVDLAFSQIFGQIVKNAINNINSNRPNFNDVKIEKGTNLKFHPFQNGDKKQKKTCCLNIV